MSMLLMVAAMKSKIGNPIRKLVLIKLADNANDEGICWPSYRHIADHCEIDRKTAMRHIQWLEDNKFLSKTYRKDDERGNKSNVYRVDIASGIEHLGAQNDQPSTTESPPPSPTESPRTSHSLEPIIEPVIISGATAPTKPKRKTKAESLFDKIRKSDFSLINQASDEILMEWCKHRIKKGASDSDLAHREVEKHLQILLDHNLTVDQSLTEHVSRGWVGLKSDWFDCVKTGVSANSGNYNPDSDWTKNISETF